LSSPGSRACRRRRCGGPGSPGACDAAPSPPRRRGPLARSPASERAQDRRRPGKRDSVQSVPGKANTARFAGDCRNSGVGFATPSGL
jgi:hypothetical protein